MTNRVLQLLQDQQGFTAEDALQQAYEAVAEEIDAVAEDALLPVTLDVVGAVASVTGVLPRLREFRPQLAVKLPNFDLARFDRLEQYAQALSLLQGVYRTASAPKSDVAALGAELTIIRDRMYASAMALVECGLIEGAQLKSCKTEIGYRALAEDVFTLVAMFREHWQVAQGRTAVDLTSLGKWRTQAYQLVESVGVRDKAPPTVGEVALARQKAFTLFVRTYEAARNAIHYLRADADDGDNIAPSLYAGRGPAKRSRKEEPSASIASTSSGSSKEEASAAPPVRIDNPHGLPLTPAFTS
ncbi:MAG: hypothetical protein RL685_574 [Pseudomonadota bacterium]|jgi:hypothetical protein